MNSNSFVSKLSALSLTLILIAACGDKSNPQVGSGVRFVVGEEDGADPIGPCAPQTVKVSGECPILGYDFKGALWSTEVTYTEMTATIVSSSRVGSYKETHECKSYLNEKSQKTYYWRLKKVERKLEGTVTYLGGLTQKEKSSCTADYQWGANIPQSFSGKNILQTYEYTGEDRNGFKNSGKETQRIRTMGGMLESEKTSKFERHGAIGTPGQTDHFGCSFASPFGAGHSYIYKKNGTGQDFNVDYKESGQVTTGGGYYHSAGSCESNMHGRICVSEELHDRMNAIVQEAKDRAKNCPNP